MHVLHVLQLTITLILYVGINYLTTERVLSFTNFQFRKKSRIIISSNMFYTPEITVTLCFNYTLIRVIIIIITTSWRLQRSSQQGITTPVTISTLVILQVMCHSESNKNKIFAIFSFLVQELLTQSISYSHKEYPHSYIFLLPQCQHVLSNKHKSITFMTRMLKLQLLGCENVSHK